MNAQSDTHQDDMFTNSEVWVLHVFLDGIQNFYKNSDCGNFVDLTEDESEATRMAAHHAYEAREWLLDDLSDDPHLATFEIGIRYSPALAVTTEARCLAIH